MKKDKQSWPKQLLAKGRELAKKESINKWAPLIILLAALSFSFHYGWYDDPSKPVGGRGWADQDLYTLVANKFANGELPEAKELHYAVGYPLLGAVGSFFVENDPFVLVSLALLLGSATFCFLGARKLFGTIWALLFCYLLFYWDQTARTFHFAFELFAMPWNNQVLFFAFAFFFWLFATRSKERPSLALVLAASFIAGLSFVTREETILFVAPIMAGFLFITKSEWWKWTVCYAVIGLCFLPQVVIKAEVLGSVGESGRGTSYSDVRDQYLQPHLLYRNTWETFIDSKRFEELGPPPEQVEWCNDLPPGNCAPDPERSALLPIAYWLWLSPLGIALILLLKRYSIGLKIFVVVSGLLMLFYLSGANMGAIKLKFHSIRYVAPGFIALNLAVVVVFYEAWRYISNKTRKSVAGRTTTAVVSKRKSEKNS